MTRSRITGKVRSGVTVTTSSSANVDIRPVGDHPIVVLGVSDVRVDPDVLPIVFHRSVFRRVGA